MKLVKIDFTTVSSALDNRKQTGGPIPFNTSFHSIAEAPDLVRPNDSPYSFKSWLPLILRTRQQPITITAEAGQCPPVQTIRLTLTQTRLLLAAIEASILLQQVNRTFREDLEDEIVPLLKSSLVFPPQGLFLRLDACSPKDGAGPLALRRVEDVLLKVVTSVRVRNALVHHVDDPEGDRRVDGDGAGISGLEMFFLPFDERMAGDREYRVFCRPGDGRVTGISQYRWYRPWRFAGLGEEEQERVAKRIVEEAEEVRGMVLDEVRHAAEEDPLMRLLLEQGFSFDLFFDEDHDTCSLVELNTFGVRSACGSCLFQWVRDRRVLYGSDEAEFRVAI